MIPVLPSPIHLSAIPSASLISLLAGIHIGTLQVSAHSPPGAIGSGTSRHITSLDKASLAIQWKGIGIQLFGNVSRASCAITIDDEAVDASSSQDLTTGMLFSVGNLDDENHNLTLVVHTDAADALFEFDYAIISALPSPANVSQSNFTEQVLPDTFAFVGRWSFVNDSESSHQSTTKGDSASIQFMGTAIQFRGTTSPQAGSYSVFLDNVSTSFSARSSFLESDSLLFFASGLDAEATHTLQIVNNANQTELVFPVDGVSVWALEKPSSPTAVEPGDATQRVSPNPSQKSPKNRARTAAIAGSAVSVGFLLAVVILVLWVRKRRRLWAAQRTAVAEQYLEARERVSQARNLQTKYNGTTNADNLPQTDPFSIEPQRRVLAANNGVEEDSPREETMTVRMRRVEAQLETLLTMGLPARQSHIGGSPPSYRT
ncbi:hypothetical protein MVEN_02572600 [Mycena venus]|uniref:Transmembrane protein n=1 Tax=Mycena venus TaxID=2733690 RepID=A0A8H6U3R9_9AGAR|nr:hypothetical protein MVEN_02572600 [Mycena venus]